MHESFRVWCKEKGYVELVIDKLWENEITRPQVIGVILQYILDKRGGIEINNIKWKSMFDIYKWVKTGLEWTQ